MSDMDKSSRLIIIALVSAVVLTVIGLAIYFLTRPSYALKAGLVREEPALDGRANEAVWASAPETVIAIKDGEPVTLKAVYSAEKIFFMARWKDSTKDVVDEPWVFDGKKWNRTRRGDQFAFFFDIGDSIIDFPTKGFAVMNFGFKPGQRLWEFGIKGPRNDQKIWEGAGQRADVWMMHGAISSPFDKGDDGYFAVNPAYGFSPTTAQPYIWVQWDAPARAGMLALNTTAWREALKVEAGQEGEPIVEEQPYLRYKDGLDIRNTPYPYKDQVVEITDYSGFKKGDVLPYVMFDRQDPGSWGGSRADINGTMRWEKGYWTLELSRKLATGNPDDIKFPQQKAVYFGVLVRADGKTIHYSVPATLEFVSGGNQ